MSRRCWSLAILALSTALTSCASTSGSWYYQRDPDKLRGNIYVATVNRTNRTVTIGKIEINKGSPGTASWTITIDREFKPGQLIIVELDPIDRSCQVPISAVMTQDGKEVRVKLARTMPTALPNEWVSCAKESTSASAMVNTP